MSLKGKQIVFTGTLAMKRADATKQATDAGAKVMGSISGNTDILVAGPGAGSKMDQAKAKGIDVWTEEEFVAAVSGGGGVGKKGKAKAVAAPKDEPPAKKSRTAVPKAAKGEKTSAVGWEIEMDDGWKPYADADAELLEAEFQKRGPKAKFTTKDFSFNAEFQTPYAMDFGKMTQTNKESKSVRQIRRISPSDDDEMEVEEKPTSKAKTAPKAEPKTAPKASASKPSSSGGSGVIKADREVPGADSYTVLDDWDAKLMQTNIGDSNNNKFYIIQVLKGPGGFFSWNRWGRLGAVGQNKMEGPYSDATPAINSFRKKFKDKTKNDWDNRHSFVKHHMQYQFVEVEAGEEGGGDDALLGKLSVAQIEKGQAVLAKIEAALKGGSKVNFAELSGSFYSLIPTQSGFSKPPVINNDTLLGEKQAQLEFWLRMGFEDMKEDEGLTPIDGLLKLPLPKTLAMAASNVSDAGSIKTSQKRGEELASKQCGGPIKQMDKELYAAIVLYTGNSIYRQLNAALRSENRKQVQKYFNYLRLFVEAMEFMPKKQRKLWRGISANLFDQYTEGKVITWWSVSSCTSDESVARNFMNGCGGDCTLIIIDSKTAMDITPLSIYPHEKESLLAPGTQLKVKSRKRVGKVAEIHCEEVGRLLS